jgi:chromate transporter
MTHLQHVSRASFLKDVLVCSLGAYGGPEAHIGVFMDQLVTKRKYLSEEELIELVALCSILPGPTSTQTIVAVGHKVGGPALGLLTMLVWALPVLVVMTLLSFLYGFLALVNLSSEGLRYIGPLAVGFIVVAAFRIGKKVITDKLTLFLMLFAAVTTVDFPAGSAGRRRREHRGIPGEGSVEPGEGVTTMALFHCVRGAGGGRCGVDAHLGHPAGPSV